MVEWLNHQHTIDTSRWHKQSPTQYWHRLVKQTATNALLKPIGSVNNHQRAIDTLKPCPYTQDHAHLIARGVMAEAKADS